MPDSKQISPKSTLPSTDSPASVSPEATDSGGGVPASPKVPGAKAPSAAESKKPAEQPKAPEAKAPPAAESKKPAEQPKAPEAKAPSAAESKKSAEQPKAPEAKAPPAVESKKPAEQPKAPEAKAPPAAESKKSAEQPKAPESWVPPETDRKPEAGTVRGPDQSEKELPKGMRITQVFADRLDKPNNTALNVLPIPKEGEAFSMRLHPDYFFEFLDHPFSINREVADYKDLYDSIKANGINEPVKARPRAGGGLELLSGHRRHDVAKQLGYPVPVVIVREDDDSARIEVVDGNLHRQDIPTSELARAAKMKMEALARKAGRRSKMDQLTGPGKRTDQIVAEDMGMSRNQVNRLVRIDALVPELKQQVDDKKLPFNTAVELSFLKPEEQGKVVDFIKKEETIPTLAQATQLKEASRAAQASEKAAAKAGPDMAAAPSPADSKLSSKVPEKKPGTVDEKKIAAIIRPKAEPEQKYTFTSTELKEYFSADRLPTTSEVKRKVFAALDLQKQALERQQAKQALKEGMKTLAR